MANGPKERLRSVYGKGDRELTTIEPLLPEYFASVAQWLSNPATNQWLASEWRDRVIDPIVIGVAVRNKRNRFFLVRHEGQPCGLVALADWDAIDKIAMVWYALGDSALGGRGIISKAVRLLVQTAFTEFQIEALYAWIREDNARSRRVLEKTGFREVGHLRSAVCRDGRRADRVYFDLTSEDLAVSCPPESPGRS
jgi:RimJ/RimL family protein N-acetyltransferase